MAQFIFLRMKKSLFVVVCLLPIFLYSQDSNLGNWWIFFGNKKINNQWNWHSEVQYRNYNAIGDLEQLLLRTGIGYDLSENNNNLLFGYGYILSQNYIGNTEDKLDVNEHRLYLQFITRQNFGGIRWQHRYRFEQRWVEKDFKLRFRYFLSLNIPLVRSPEKDKEFYFSAYNEIFLNTKANVFDRNRLYGGLGYRFSQNYRFELGYMNQFFNNGGRDQINLVSFISL